jgi:hypothetical protein
MFGLLAALDHQINTTLGVVAPKQSFNGIDLTRID